MEPDLLIALAVLAAVVTSFVISASAGLGGSLLLVPTLALLMGGKEGVALAAVLLAGNNIFKVVAYRKTLPFAKSTLVVGVLSVGAALGASLLVRAPEATVAAAVILAIAGSLQAERKQWRRPRLVGAPLREPVAWHGPIVMNTEDQLRQAYDELRAGTFIE